MREWDELSLSERRRYTRLIGDGPALITFMEDNHNNSQELLRLAEAARASEDFAREIKERAAARVFHLGDLAVSEIARHTQVTRPTIYAWGKNRHIQDFGLGHEAIVADSVFLLDDDAIDMITAGGYDSVSIAEFIDRKVSSNREPITYLRPEAKPDTDDQPESRSDDS